jgi:hypothetical protein
LRPDAIKAEVSGYIRSRGEELVNNITEAARRNPMQAVAVGARVAYPLMRLARAIPFPILMIGAGLFFAGSKTGRDLTQKASDIAEDVTDEARRWCSLKQRPLPTTSNCPASNRSDGRPGKKRGRLLRFLFVAREGPVTSDLSCAGTSAYIGEPQLRPRRR